MPEYLEKIFNDCYERLLAGESLESCLSRYPEHAAELNSMLHTLFDVKRRTYQVQPRPEFKYWSRVKLQGALDYMDRHPVEKKQGFAWNRGWSIALTALLVFIMASTSTAAASSNAMPDQALYGVKMAVEQAQVTLTTNEADKATLYAELAEKRANEIQTLASQGNTAAIPSVSARMNYQLDQAMTLVEFESGDSNIQVSNLQSTIVVPSVVQPAETSTSQTSTTTFEPTTQENTATSTVTIPAIGTSTAQETDNTKNNSTTATESGTRGTPTRSTEKINKARTSINSSTANSLTILQNTLDNLPESSRQDIIELIEHTKAANDQVSTPVVVPSTGNTIVVPETHSNTQTQDNKSFSTSSDNTTGRSGHKSSGNRK